MKTMKQAFLIGIFLIAFSITNAQDNVNYQQIGLDYFMNNLYNSELFKNECTELRFDRDYCLKVYLDSVYAIDLQMHLVEKNKNNRKLQEKYLNDTMLTNKNITPKEKLVIRYDNYKNVERYPFSKAPYENIGIATLKKGRDFDNYQNNFNCYLLRFSNSMKYEDRTFIELWIKRGYHSSGARVFIEFDSENKIIDYRVYNTCDDWG